MDFAYTKWEKVTKKLLRPRVDSVFRGDLEEEFPDDEKYYEFQLECDILNDYLDGYDEEDGAELDKKITADLIPLAFEAEEKIKTLLKKR